MAITHLLAPGMEALHTYQGAFFHSPAHGCYIPDPWRSHGTIALGGPESGVRDWLAAQAFADAGKQRPVIIVDAYPTRQMLDNLWYWNHVVAGRPFLAFLPGDTFAGLSHSWNPLATSTQSIQSIGETIFSGYQKPEAESKDTAVRTQRTVFVALLRAMQSTELAFCLRDVRAAIEDPKALEALGKLVKRSGKRHYDSVTREAQQLGEEWLDEMEDFTNYLRNFDAYTLNSYNPQIDLEWLIYTDATIYFGLPVVGPQAGAAAVLGQLLLQQISVLASWIQTNARLYRRSVSLLVNGAGAFVRSQLVETLQRMRGSGLLATLAFDDVASITRVDANLPVQLAALKPNVLAFPGIDEASARWFCQVAGENNQPVGGAESLTKAGPGQCHYLSCAEQERAVRLVPASLPPAPPLPLRQYHRLQYPNPPQRRGLNLTSQRSPEADGKAKRQERDDGLAFDPEKLFYPDFEKELFGGG